LDFARATGPKKETFVANCPSQVKKAARQAAGLMCRVFSGIRGAIARKNVTPDHLPEPAPRRPPGSFPDGGDDIQIFFWRARTNPRAGGPLRRFFRD
jgi:hypothetical protein